MSLQQEQLNSHVQILAFLNPIINKNLSSSKRIVAQVVPIFCGPNLPVLTINTFNMINTITPPHTFIIIFASQHLLYLQMKKYFLTPSTKQKWIYFS